MRLLILICLLPISVFGQSIRGGGGGTISGGATGAGGGSNATVVIAGTNVTVTTNSSFSYTVSASASGSSVSSIVGITVSKGNTALATTYATLNLANTAANAGDTVIVGPGYYTGHDLGKDGVNWFFTPGAILQWDGTGNSGAIFTDNSSVAWLGNFAQATNSMKFTIAGNAIATNLTGYFIALAGPLSDVSVEMSELGSTSRTSPGYVCLVDTYSFPAVTNYLNPRFNFRANKVRDCILYNSEFSGRIFANLYTNVFFYIDRDTTNSMPDLVFEGGEAQLVNIFHARPYGSRTIFKIPKISAGNTGTLLSKTIRGLALSWYGELVFDSCVLQQNTTNGNFIDLYGDADSFAVIDYASAPTLTLKNCQFVGRTGGVTNIVDWSRGVRTNSPSMLIVGDVTYTNATRSSIPVISPISHYAPQFILSTNGTGTNVAAYSSGNATTDTNTVGLRIAPSIQSSNLPVGYLAYEVNSPYTNKGNSISSYAMVVNVVSNGFFAGVTNVDVTVKQGWNVDRRDINDFSHTYQEETAWNPSSGVLQAENWHALTSPNTLVEGTNISIRFFDVSLQTDFNRKFIGLPMTLSGTIIDYVNPTATNQPGIRTIFNANKFGAIQTLKGTLTVTTNDNDNGQINEYGGLIAVGDTTGAKGFRLRYDYSGSIGHAGQSAIYEIASGQGFIILGHTNISLSEGGIYLPGTQRFGTNTAVGTATLTVGPTGSTNSGNIASTGNVATGGDLQQTNGHIVAFPTAAPTFTPNASGLGTGPTVTIQTGSSDGAGHITFLSGSAPSGTTIGVLNFQTAFADTNYFVIFNNDTSPGRAWIAISKTTGGFTFSCPALSALSTYDVTYYVRH